VDEYRIRVAPVVAGSRKRLLADGGGMKKTMRLIVKRTFGSGVVGLTYKSARNDR
jgi:hypothetical protein